MVNLLRMANGLPICSPTAGVTGKGEPWRISSPDAESAVWDRFPESAGLYPHFQEHAVLARFWLWNQACSEQI